MFYSGQVRGRPEVFPLSPLKVAVHWQALNAPVKDPDSLSEGINRTKSWHFFLVSSGPVWWWEQTSSHSHDCSSLLNSRSGPLARRLGLQSSDGAGKLRRPFNRAFPGEASWVPIRRRADERCMVINECWCPDPWAWTQRQPSKTHPTPPLHTHSPTLEFVLMSYNGSIENSAAIRPLCLPGLQ